MSNVAVVDNYAILVDGTNNIVYYMDITKATWQTVALPDNNNKQPFTKIKNGKK